MSWCYTQGDPGLTLFTAALNAGAPMGFAPRMRVLEIGCCEADWLHKAHEAWPDVDFVGIDTRAPDVVSGDGKVTRMRRDARDATLFEPVSFDAVVSVSAIEHIGLGHYKDPKDPDGDTAAMANVWRWLKPGGWVYFDVPYDPTGYRVLNTECRIYDDAARWSRLWVEPLAAAKASAQWLWDGYVDSTTPGRLIEKPTTPAKRYWYAASVWRKVH